MNPLFNDVLNYALRNNIGFNLIPNLSPYSPSFAVPVQHRIVINTNWHNRKELPFIVAHEISHILNNDNSIIYFSTSISFKLSAERNANLRAISILIPLYIRECNGDVCNNVYIIMNQLGIPYSLKNYVIKKIKDILN